MRDIPIDDGPVVVEFLRQRFVCRVCGKSWQEAHPALDMRRDMTVRFTDWLGNRAAEQQFTSLARAAGVNRKSVQRVAGDRSTAIRPSMDLLSNFVAVELVKVAGRRRPVVWDMSRRAIRDIFVSPAAAKIPLRDLAALLRRRGGGSLVVDARLALAGNPNVLTEMAGPGLDVALSLSSLLRELRGIIDEALRGPIATAAGRSGVAPAPWIMEAFRRRPGELPPGHLEAATSNWPSQARAAYAAKEELLRLAGESLPDEHAVRRWFGSVLGSPAATDLLLVARRIRTEWPKGFDDGGLPRFNIHVGPLAIETGKSSESFAAVRSSLIARDGDLFASGR